MKYCVTIVRTGCIFVEADNMEDAIDIANHQTTVRCTGLMIGKQPMLLKMIQPYGM